MRDIEILARFLAFRFFATKYPGRMKAFLDQTFEAFNKDWKNCETKVAIAKSDFDAGVTDLLRVFGENLARKPDSVQFNRAIFDALTRAFLVLCHAEIETYLEEWAKEIARSSEKVWNASGKITLPMGFLLATLSEGIGVPDNLVTPNSKDSPERLKEESVRLFQEFYKRIKDNHGIKERNVLDLFAPLGLPSSALGATLLPDLESLGKRRGLHAHHSVKAVLNTLDAETEYKSVKSVVKQLIQLDEWLVKYKRGIR